jgi:hypothetical protein
MPPRSLPISLLVARRVTLPTSSAARSPTLLLVFRALSNNHASRPRRAPPETPFPTPARILRARIPHVSISQNMGSAHAIPPKTPRNPTSCCAHTTREFSTYFAFCPAVSVLGDLIFTPQIGSTTISPLSRNSVATRRATNPRRTNGTASIQSWFRDARHRRVRSRVDHRAHLRPTRSLVSGNDAWRHDSSESGHSCGGAVSWCTDSCGRRAACVRKGERS